jgi:hypothetical protein
MQCRAESQIPCIPFAQSRKRNQKAFSASLLGGRFGLCG